MEVHNELLMRPVLMATGKPGVASGGGGGGGGGSTPVTFNPVPGEYDGYTNGDPDTSFTITASASVVWNWSSTGTVPSSTKANGASGTSITFGLSTAGAPKGSTITVTVGDDEWIINLAVDNFDPPEA